VSTELKISYAPPTGKPLGATAWFKFGATVVRPILNSFAKRDWRGAENLPKTGAAIVVCNHISYVDPLLFTHYLYDNGRAPRYLGKASLFKLPIIGRVLLGAGQIPVAVIPCAQWGAQRILPAYSKKPRLFPRSKVTVIAGPALDLSKWSGRAEDPVALEEATAYVMSAITKLLEQIRNEKAPSEIFDPKKSALPRTGNFKKDSR